YYMFFSVDARKSSNPNDNTVYYNATNILLQYKESDEHKTFVPIPLFTTRNESSVKVKEKLVNNEYLSSNHSFSLHEDDVRPFVIIREKSSHSNKTIIEDFSLIGPFHQQSYKEKFGVKFSGNNENMKSLSVTKED